MNAKTLILCIATLFAVCGCDNYFRNDYKDNSPTSGKLKVYYEEGLHKHVSNQAYTFGALYPDVHIELYRSSDKEALSALLNDSCEAIVISRLPGTQEERAFASRGYTTKHTAVAMSGVALITGIATPLTAIPAEEVAALLSGAKSATDSSGTPLALQFVFDSNNSAVLNYMKDSVAGGKPLGSNCNALNSTMEVIAHVSKNINSVGVIDFAWISDAEDSLSRAISGSVRLLGLGRSGAVSYPNQSSFKLGEYPFCRTVYVIRKTGSFSLAKGFESFVAGPKGQLTLLKQGLMPARQQERSIEVKIE